MACAHFVNDFSETVKKQLECTVCLELSTKEIFMCVNGHNVCSSCQPKISSCPVCRDSKRPEIRNRLAEELALAAKVDCKNEQKGCKEIMIGKDLGSHLRGCKFNLQCQFEFCTWEGPILDLASHGRILHMQNFIELSKDGVILEINDIKGHDAMRKSTASNLGKARYTTLMLMLNNHLFWYHSEITENHHFNVQLQLIGPIGTESAAEFSYQLDSFSGVDAGTRYKNNVRLIQSLACSDKIFGDKLEGQNCFKVLKVLGVMTYRLKIFPGPVDKVGFSTKVRGSQMRASKPANWVEDPSVASATKPSHGRSYPYSY